MTTSAYENYEMDPHEHLKQAEQHARVGADLLVRSTELSQVYATLALAHATIAQAQMKGAMRA